MPLADRELDQLITQASNDNIPLIDLGLSAPEGGPPKSSGAMRVATACCRWRIQQIRRASPAHVAVLVDRDRGPDVELLKSLKAKGYRVAFSSGGATQIR